MQYIKQILDERDDLLKQNKELLEALERMLRMREAHLNSEVVPDEPELETVQKAREAINNAKY